MKTRDGTSPGRSETPQDQVLRWVFQNRQPRRKGSWVGALAADLAARDLATRQRFHFVTETLEPIVDDAFFRLCRVESVRQGRLVLVVSDADVRYHMEKRWRSVLADALARSSGRTQPWQVVFRVARANP